MHIKISKVIRIKLITVTLAKFLITHMCTYITKKKGKGTL